MFNEPDVSEINATILGTEPVGDPETSNTVASTSQTAVEYSWGASSAEVETTYCGVGTSPQHNDIFPETPVSLCLETVSDMG